MLYDNCIQQIEKLKELLVFQERRNFFNKFEDKHLNASLKIVESILDKSYKFEFSYEDLAEVIKITTQIVSLLNITTETKEHLNKMNEYAEELKLSNLDFIKKTNR